MEEPVAHQAVSVIRVMAQEFSAGHQGRNRSSACFYRWAARMFPRLTEEAPDQSTSGSISWAKRFRARFRRLFTVPRLQSVISAISS